MNAQQCNAVCFNGKKQSRMGAGIKIAVASPNSGCCWFIAKFPSSHDQAIRAHQNTSTNQNTSKRSMGKSSLAISNVGSSTHRKPLSLKPQQSNFKKTVKKVGNNENEAHVSMADKENSSGNVLISERNDSMIKEVHMTTGNVQEESIERLAIRRRIEEAVAAHLASRELESQASEQPVAVIELPDPSADQCEPNNALSAKVATPTMSVKQPEQKAGTSTSVFRFLSFLMVVAVAIWACLRVAVIEPLPSTVRFQRVNGPVQLYELATLPPVVKQAYIAPIAVEPTASNLPVSDVDTQGPVGEMVQLADAEDAAPVEEEGDVDVISLDDPETPSPLSGPVAALPAPSGSDVALSRGKLASGHVVATVRKFAEMLRPVKEFMRKLRSKAGVAVDRLRKWLKFA